MLKAVLFDLDGTLLDTLADIRAHVNGMLRAFSYPEISLEQARAFVGDGAHRLIERSLPDGAPDREACYSYFIERFSHSDQAETRLFEGELPFLHRLKEQGLKLAVVTNKPQAAAEGCIQRFFPQGLFDFIGGDTGMLPCKPDPSLARYCALTLRVSPSECAFVGDGETDVLTASSAGMLGVSVLWGYRTQEQLRAVGATRFASDFAALEKILKNS